MRFRVETLRYTLASVVEEAEAVVHFEVMVTLVMLMDSSSNSKVIGMVPIHRASEDLAGLEAGEDHPEVEEVDLDHGSHLISPTETKIAIIAAGMGTLQKTAIKRREIWRQRADNMGTMHLPVVLMMSRLIDFSPCSMCPRMH